MPCGVWGSLARLVGWLVGWLLACLLAQNGRAPHHGVQALGGGVSSASAAGATQGADKKASSVVGLETEDVLPATHPWFALDTVWEANEKLALQTGTMPALLTPSWKVLLLSDGSVTRHLQLLTDISVEVGMIDETHVGTPYGTPTGTERIRGPLLQRQVYLKRSGGEALAYAASWWSAEDMKEYMKDGDKPIWQNLAARRAELYREVQRVYLGNNEELEKEFGFKGPFWGRHYTFWHNGRPLTLIYEVFSPRLEKWLGSSHPEGFDSLWSS